MYKRQGEAVIERIKQLKKFDWRLFIALCALALIPAIYQALRTSLISSTNQNSIFNIIGQMEWFDLINETLQAFLIIPLYSILNNLLKKDKINFAGHTFKTGFLTFIVYTLFSIGVLVYGGILIKAMNSNEVDVITMKKYLQLETIAFMIKIIVSFVNVVFVVIGKDKNVYIFLSIQTILSLFSDFILIPRFGVYGIAVSNIIVNAILSITAISLLFFQKQIRPCWFYKKDLSLLKEWVKIGFFSGIQQFIDNIFYAIMVCKMVNMVSEQGNYWIANNFIWGWLLIPITAMSEIIRRDCKDGYSKLNQSNYYFIAFIIIIIWISTIPLWMPFYQYAENLQNAEEVFWITVKLFPFYIAYAGCAIIDNIFIGLGKTIYTAINSLIINLIYYGIFYLLYLTGSLSLTMNTIILMFGFGMVVHLAISLIEEKVVYSLIENKKRGIAIT